MQTAFELIPVGLFAITALGWWMEMRTVQKLRDGHQERMFKLQTEHANTMSTLRLQHEADLARERSESWKEGVRAGSEARRQMRYNQHSQHSHNNKPGRF